jgi:hypothetical protein
LRLLDFNFPLSTSCEEGEPRLLVVRTNLKDSSLLGLMPKFVLLIQMNFIQIPPALYCRKTFSYQLHSKYYQRIRFLKRYHFTAWRAHYHYRSLNIQKEEAIHIEYQKVSCTGDRLSQYSVLNFGYRNRRGLAKVIMSCYNSLSCFISARSLHALLSLPIYSQFSETSLRNTDCMNYMV